MLAGMTDTLTAASSDTVVRVPSTEGPSAEAAKPTLVVERRRSTVLPRIQWEGAIPVPSAQPRLRFEELEALGAGGMGEVVLAKDHDIERTVAIKRLKDQSDLGMVVRFVDEIRTVGALEHPNIVPVHDVGVDEAGRYYMVMKHLRGESLESIIDRLRKGDRAAHDRFTFPVRVQVFQAILHAMAYAHQQGFIHRDLKPANIMVGPYGEVTVMDWGLARHLHRAEVQTATHTREGTVLETQVGALMGTPHYMSPEQARGEHDRVDARCDIYALSVLFHEFLYLEHYLDDLQDLKDVLEAVQQRAPRFRGPKQGPHQRPGPAEFEHLLGKGLAKDPDQRYRSIEEMLAEIQRSIEGRVGVHCRRTFTKRMLQEAIHGIDAHPVVGIAAAVGVLGFFVTGVVSVVLRFI
jgi:serine/threonine-protein kinase